MNVNVMGDQVLLHSHVLCSTSQFPSGIEGHLLALTNESLKNRG